MNEIELKTKIEGLEKAIKEHDDFSQVYQSDLAKYEQELKEGPAFEYKKQHKNVEKSLKSLQKSYLDFYELLRKKGMDDEASEFLDNYKKNVVDFTKKYKKDFRKLM